MAPRPIHTSLPMRRFRRRQWLRSHTLPGLRAMVMVGDVAGRSNHAALATTIESDASSMVKRLMYVPARCESRLRATLTRREQHDMVVQSHFILEHHVPGVAGNFDRLDQQPRPEALREGEATGDEDDDELRNTPDNIARSSNPGVAVRPTV